MEINQVVETPSGALKVEGTLSADELKFVVEFALNVLLARGTMSFTNIVPIPTNEAQESVN